MRPSYYRFDKIRYHADLIRPALARSLKNRRRGSVWIVRDGIKAVGYAGLAFNFDLEFGGFDGLVTDLFKSREIPSVSSLLEVSIAIHCARTTELDSPRRTPAFFDATEFPD